MLLIKELAAACPNTDPLARGVVELGINAMNGACHDEAANNFTVAANSTAFSSKYIRLIYEDLTALFGCDIESIYLTTRQKRCQVFLSAGKPDKALEAHKYMMHAIDESAKAGRLDWSNGKFSVMSPEATILTRNSPEFNENVVRRSLSKMTVMQVEIPGQEQDGYDAEPNLFHIMQQRSQISRP
ncbi:hypothetical protein BDR07DRAFT_1490304 [Suillus spraguei]|nr:hypothetical protein BDR07DRAFT_1490304 [Suillus spraguei]